MYTATIQPAERPVERDTPRDKVKDKPRPESAERFRAALHPHKQAQAAAAKQPRFVVTRQGDNPAVTRAFPNVNPQLSAKLKLGQTTLPQPQAQPPLAGQAAGAQTLAELKQLASQQQSNAAETAGHSADGASASTTAADAPTITAVQSQAVATAATTPSSPTGGQAPLASPALLQQVVEFAAVSRNADGQSEFRLGFQQHTLDGARLKLTRLGRGRVSLQLTGTGISDAEVQQLIAALKTRRVEVAEVEHV
ncbi:MAG: hypothetical protein AAF333_02435 [Planctomycetota bacterium]